MRIKTKSGLWEVGYVTYDNLSLFADTLNEKTSITIVYKTMFEALSAYEKLFKDGALDACDRECRIWSRSGE